MTMMATTTDVDTASGEAARIAQRYQADGVIIISVTAGLFALTSHGRGPQRSRAMTRLTEQIARQMGTRVLKVPAVLCAPKG